MTLHEISSLVLVGAGKMGGALLEGWLAGGLDPTSVSLIDPAPGEEMRALIGSQNLALNPAFDDIQGPTAVVLAVKPQAMAAVLGEVAPLARPGSVVLSVAAGWTIGNFQKVLGSKAAIVRAMPNTPAAVGRGVSVLCANAQVSAEQRALCGALLAAVGEVHWIDDETLMDAVTGVSGSGPAYVFYLAECLAEAGIAAGLPPDLAAGLARATVSGAGELLHRSPLAAAKLRENVTSPGGTTAAALEVLRAEEGLKALMEKAVAAAVRRSRELSS